MMFKRIILSIFILLYGTQLFALRLKGPFLILGNSDESKFSKKACYKLHDFFKLKDVVISPKKEIYLLESGNACVNVFDMKGNFKRKLGTMGQGPAEFYQPYSLDFVGSNLWVVDFRNGRIQEFENDQFRRVIKVDGISMPKNIAVAGKNVFVASSSIYPRIGALTVLDHDGNLRKKIKITTEFMDKKGGSLWSTVKLKALDHDRLLVGYQYVPIIFIIESDLVTIKRHDMSDYYTIFGGSSGKNSLAPGGYAVTAFSPGPDDTILVSACDQEKRKCTKIMQFDANLSKQIDTFDMNFHIWEMRYFPKHGLMALIKNDDEVLFYEVL